MSVVLKSAKDKIQERRPQISLLGLLGREGEVSGKFSQRK